MTEVTPGMQKILDALDGPKILPDTPHYEAIGRFVASYATAEAAVHMLARYLSGLPDEKARIVFGGMRLPDLIDIIRKFARIDGVKANIYDEIDNCLSQLNHISTKRHSIVHRSSSIFDGKLVVTNVLTAKVLKSTESEVFEIREMADMQRDCGRIYLRLSLVFRPEAEWDPNDRASILALLHLPWLYKHKPPKTPNLKSRGGSSESPPLLLASLGKSPERGR